MNPTIIFLIFYCIGSIVILWCEWKLVKYIIQKKEWIPDVYRMYTYLVTVSKYEESEESNQQKIPVKERLANAEMLFSILGGVRAQRDWKAKLYGRHDHFALEIIVDNENLVSFYITMPGYMQSFMEHQILAQYSHAYMEKIEDYNIFCPIGHIYATRLTLKKPYIFPIKTYAKMEVDPLNAMTNVLSKCVKSERAAIQIVARSAHPRWHSWGARIARTMQQGKTLREAMRTEKDTFFGKFLAGFSKTGSSIVPKKKDEDPMKQKDKEPYRLSPMEEEVVKSLEEKTAKAGFEVNIRLVVSSPTKEQAERTMSNMINSFSGFSGYEYTNAFRAQEKKENAKLIHQFIYRAFDKKRQMILNCEEMASIWHLPDISTETPNIRWLMAKKAAPPTNLPQDGLILGKVIYRNKEHIVKIKREDRRRHMYIIGKSGVGKSVLQSSMIMQDIQNGEGVGVIDPHGDLIEDILPQIPKERADDVIIFDPSDTERPIGLNMLEYELDEEKDFAVQELVSIFYKLFGQEMIGPMFEHYMRNAMLALMEDKEEGATIIEIPRLFTDAKFRQAKIKKVKNIMVKNFWEQEFAQSQRGQQSADMLSYLISKIGRFLSNDMMRNMVGQAASGFNFNDILNNRKIFLVNLAKGKIGEVNAKLLGLIMVSKIQMASFRRASLPKELRKDFYLYIDEFQNFTTDSIVTILSEARKYLLNLIIAHQYIGQLVEKGDTMIKDAVFGNAGTMIVFRVGPEDSEFLKSEFGPIFNENDLMNVEKYTANIKLLIDNTASLPFNMRTILPPKGNSEIGGILKKISRLKYGREKIIVEEEIKRRSKLGELGNQSPPTATEQSL